LPFALNGGPKGTVSELLLEKKHLIPSIQQLLISASFRETPKGVESECWKRYQKMEEEREHARWNEEKWDSRAKTYDESFHRFYFHFTQKRVVSLLNLHENQCFLDIGCGTGWAVRYAASVVQSKGEFYGVDISPKMIEKAEENCARCENIYFYNADAAALPFEGDFFDFIICTSSFHHYFSPSKVLNEVYRVLKPGGKIYIADITTDGFIMKMVEKWLQKKEREHVKQYSTQEYKIFFAEARLSYITSKLITPPVKVHIAEK
jgi:ubiquinone/menaquinone biosynthesis C-methylase UbiE